MSDLNIRIDTSDGSKLNFANQFRAIPERLSFETGGLFECSNEVDYIISNEQLLVGDYDGDGYIELLIHAIQFDLNNYWPECLIYYNNIEHYHNFYYADLIDVQSNGKGFIKSTITSTLKMQSREDDEHDQVNAQAIPINYNGNRKTDLMLITDNTNDHGFYEYNTLNGQFVKINNNMVTELGANLCYYTGDFNGDGLTDLLYYRRTAGNVWRLRYGTGSDFSDEYAIDNFNFGGPDPYDENDINDVYSKDFPYVFDLNGDGRTDILWFTYDIIDCTPLQYHIFLSYGKNKFKYYYESFTDEQWKLTERGIFDQVNIYDKRSPIIDFNGDGNFDILNFVLESTAPSKIYTSYILTLNFEDNELHLKNIYDGFNNKTSITYEPLSKGSVCSNYYGNPYTKGTSASYPVRDIGGGGYVVTSIKKYSANDFINQNSEVNYRYESGLAHLEGKGFLGFQKTTQIIPEIGGVSETNIQSLYSLVADKYILVNSINQTRIDNFLINQTVITNAFKNLSNYRYFVYQNQVYQYDYLYNTIMSKKVYTVDDWNNILTITETRGDISPPQMTITTTNTYGDINPGITWCPSNKLVSSTITQDHTDDIGPNYTRSINFSYYSATNRYRLYKSTIDPTKTGKVEIINEYDNFGNILKATTKQYADATLQDRFVNFAYDPLGRFKTAQANALGHTEVFSYEPKNGNLLNFKDCNGNIVEYEYDGFGRCTKEEIPALNNSYTNHILRWSNPLYGDPPGMCYVAKEEGSDQPTSTIFYDSWGKDMFSQTESYFPNKTIRIKKEYKMDGRIYKISQPYNTITYPTDNPAQYTENIYDIYKRPYQTIEVNNLTNGISYTTQFGYTSDEKSTTLPDGTTSYIRYYPDGSTKETEDAAGNKVKYYYNNNGKVKEIKTVGLDSQDALSVIMQYDEYGNQTHLIDMDAGTQTYEYNSFGELTKHTNPRGYTSYSYDNLGRTKTKIIAGTAPISNTEYNYNYVTGSNGIGQIESIISTDGINNYFYYDNLGRIIKTTDDIQGMLFSNECTYKSNGFLETIKYPSNVEVKNEYNSNGYFKDLLRIDLNPTGTKVWEVTNLDEKERLREYQSTGGILTTEYTFDVNDYLTEIKTYNNSGVLGDYIQNLNFEYYNLQNQSGLLKKRTDVVNNQYEEFEYDNLYRLAEYITTNNITQTASANSMTYYKDGSIKNKTGNGNYFYNSEPSNRNVIQEPAHGIKELGPVAGLKPDHSIVYTPFNSIKSIQEGSKKSIFYYGEDEQRKKMEYKVNNEIQYTKYYLDDYELIVYPDSTTKELTYIDGIAVIVKQRDNSESTYYIHTDNLGSLQSITDNNGNLLVTYDGVNPDGAEFSFDPWGNLRHKDNWISKYDNELQHPAFDIIGRGFTGHEHMTEFGLINMNGRVYDQHLGQFIQPDNNIQNPESSQSYNRFSYCANNPLAYTDPSGENFFVLLALGYNAYSIACHTYQSYNNHGREAGLNTLTSSLAFTAYGYIVGAAVGNLICAGIELLSRIDISFPNFGDTKFMFKMSSDITASTPLNPGMNAGTSVSISIGPKQFLNSAVKELIVTRSSAIGTTIGNAYGNDLANETNNSGNSIDSYISSYQLIDYWGELGIPLLSSAANAFKASYFEHNPIKSFFYTALFVMESFTLRNILCPIPRQTYYRNPSNLTINKAPASVCFPENTLVLTKDGLVPIQNLQIGDSLWTYNAESEQIELAVVENIFERKANNFVKLHFENDSVTCTPEHPFYVDNDWVQAKELQAGDLLLNANSESVSVTSILQYSTDSAATVYNLEAAGNHNFYVSTSGVLVHNCNFIEKTTISELKGTHTLTLSRTKFKALVESIKNNGINEPIKYVEYKGVKYIVDGHHRVTAARVLGIKEVPSQKVSLPYGQYKTIDDLFWE